MTTGLLTMLGILALTAVGVAWESWRSGRAFCSPIPRSFRERESQEPVWQERFPGETLATADTVLRMLCVAFTFNSDDRYSFNPDDRLQDIYRGRYPCWKFWNLGDNMELESFSLVLRKEFHVELSEQYPEVTLEGIVEMVANNRPMKG